tara:strand:+ start:152 stop:505 length:354 start_codon:yes stop_codon:yes gene_type:complete
MKQIIITLTFLFFLNSQSQTINGVPFSEIDSPYVQIVGQPKLMSSKITVFVDFGQNTKAFGSAKKQFSILDKNGKKIVFNSMIDALNFMTRIGYKLEQVYTTTSQGNTISYHYLMSK